MPAKKSWDQANGEVLILPHKRINFSDAGEVLGGGHLNDNI
jgi:hypothetical protein